MITWLDKIDGLDLANARKNVNADDMNQIKTTANANESAIGSHGANTSNPHSVTKAQVGLGSADNTADASKPVSTAQQTALDLKANLASPTFTGAPSVPTAATATNDTQAASTAYVVARILASFVWNEVPTGTINAINDTFTIANSAAFILVFADGICVNPDGFELTGTTLTLTIPPDNSLSVFYLKA